MSESSVVSAAFGAANANKPTLPPLKYQAVEFGSYTHAQSLQEHFPGSKIISTGALQHTLIFGTEDGKKLSDLDICSEDVLKTVTQDALYTALRAAGLRDVENRVQENCWHLTILDGAIRSGARLTTSYKHDARQPALKAVS